MTRWQFLWARTWGDEAALAGLGDPESAVLAELAGRHVAIVGNARALADSRHGAAIDGADIVVRLNAAPMPGPVSHGARTDWLAMSVPVDAATLAARAPARALWVSPRRKRLPWALAQRPGFALVPASVQARLAGQLGARPTTGAMMIAWLAASPAASVTLYGFDFFASLSLSGRRNARDVPHDFAAEAAWVAALMAADARVTRAV